MAAALDKGYLVEIMIKVHGFPGDGIYYSYTGPHPRPRFTSHERGQQRLVPGTNPHAGR